MDSLAREVLSVAASLGDPAMAVGYVRSVLRGLEPEDCADFLAIIHAAVRTRDPRAAELWLFVSIVLASDEESAFVDALREAFEARGQAELAEAMQRVPGPLGGLEAGSMRVPDFGKGRPVTLGERKSLARTHDRTLLMRVLRDPHPAVIRILLGNPHVTEADVIRLVALRPVHGDVLREVCGSPRWMIRPAVRVALLKNPCLPLPLGLRLAPHAGRAALRAIVASPELDGRLRDACAQALGTPTLH